MSNSFDLLPSNEKKSILYSLRLTVYHAKVCATHALDRCLTVTLFLTCACELYACIDLFSQTYGRGYGAAQGGA